MVRGEKWRKIKKKWSLQNLLYSILKANIYIVKFQNDKKEIRDLNLLQEVMAKNSPNLWKDKTFRHGNLKITQLESWKYSIRLNPSRSNPCCPRINCVCVCVCVCIHTYLHLHTNMIHIYVHIYTHINMYIVHIWIYNGI